MPLCRSRTVPTIPILLCTDCRWFHGEMSTAQADVALISNGMPGCWLVRFGRVQEDKPIRIFYISILDPSGSKQTYHLPVYQYIGMQAGTADQLVYDNQRVASWSELASRLQLSRERIVKGTPYAHV
jgi:hypothetical protein